MDASSGRDEGSRQTVSATEAPISALTRVSTLKEWATALFAQRTSCEQHSDQLSAREVEYLRFIRWLHQTGRLVS
jgi:hypothetical protein